MSTRTSDLSDTKHPPTSRAETECAPTRRSMFHRSRSMDAIFPHQAKQQCFQSNTPPLPYDTDDQPSLYIKEEDSREGRRFVSDKDNNNAVLTIKEENCSSPPDLESAAVNPKYEERNGFTKYKDNNFSLRTAKETKRPVYDYDRRFTNLSSDRDLTSSNALSKTGTEHEGERIDLNDLQSGNVTLWQFLLELLVSHQYPDIIQWTNLEGEFMLLQAEEVARLWGMRKNKNHRMNYDKLSRALRYYYQKNIIKKVHGHKFVYRFVFLPEEGLYSFQKSMGQHRDIKLSSETFTKESNTTAVNDTDEEDMPRTDLQSCDVNDDRVERFKELDSNELPTHNITDFSLTNKPSSNSSKTPYQTNLEPHQWNPTISPSSTVNYEEFQQTYKRRLVDDTNIDSGISQTKRDRRTPCCPCHCHENEEQSTTKSEPPPHATINTSISPRPPSPPSSTTNHHPPLPQHAVMNPLLLGLTPHHHPAASLVNSQPDSALHSTRHAINMERLAQQIRLQNHQHQPRAGFSLDATTKPADTASASVPRSTFPHSPNLPTVSPTIPPFHNQTRSDSKSSSTSAASLSPSSGRFIAPTSSSSPTTNPFMSMFTGSMPPCPPAELPVGVSNGQCVWMPVPVAMLSQWWPCFAAAASAASNNQKLTSGDPQASCVRPDEALNLTEYKTY